MYSLIRRHGIELRVLFLLASLTLALLALSCSSEASPASTPTPDAPSPEATPPAVSTPAGPTSTPITTTPTPMATSSAQTGIKVVDRVIAAVAAKDPFQLASLAYLEPLACTTAQGLGGPPGCLPGEAAGTIVHVLFTSSCDGHYIRQAEVESLMGRFIEDKGKLAGVYRNNGLLFPPSQYVLVYSFETPYGSLARVLFVSDPGIVGVTFGCGSSAKEYVDVFSLKDPILLPGG